MEIKDIKEDKKERNMFNKYLVLIDLKNAYNKIIQKKLFEKLYKYGINEKIIGTIKLLYSYTKLKISK